MRKMTNRDVIKEFGNYNIDPKIESHSGNLYVSMSGRKLMNYGTCLAQRVEGYVIINNSKYSTTTSKIQSYLRSEFAYATNVIFTDKDVPMWTTDLTDYCALEIL